MNEEQKSLLRIIQGRLEGFSYNPNLTKDQQTFLYDTCEMLENILCEEDVQE